MTLPTFNLDEVLSDRAQHIGELPWLSTQSLPIQNIVAHEKEEGKAVVVLGKQHALKSGERVFVAGYGPTLDHFYVVEEHDNPKHRNKAFAMELNINERLGPGLLYVPETYPILHPQHLSMQANIEMQSLELRQLEVLKAISPQNYKKTMLILLKGLGGAASAENLKADIESLTSKLGDGEDGEEIDPQAIARIQAIELEIMMREIEILCSMPKGHMGAMANKAGIGKAIKQMHGFIGGLIKTIDMEKGAPDEFQRIMRKVENALGIPKDRLEIAKHFGFVDVIQLMHQFVLQKEAEAEENEAEESTSAKKPRSRKQNGGSETIAKAS